jgi:phosphohistidine phosphatase
MDLVLWRHAEAEESRPDLARKLTGRGKRDAAKVAEWLRSKLPPGFTVLASPAERTRQTASALGVPFDTVDALAPGASVPAILRAAGWPDAGGTVIIVGHQPGLGQAAAYLMTGALEDWTIRKGGLWWFTGRVRNDDAQVVVSAVLAPELL